MQAYLERIGFDQPVQTDLATLTALQRAHMSAVPFENLHVWRGEKVRTDIEWSIDKIVQRRRGGWCFELNGAFAALLESLGFEVERLAAAVLLSGPTNVVDHVTLEVQLDEPYLVDVGFGTGTTNPLAINRRGAQDGGVGDFELTDSPNGITLSRLVDDMPEPQFRFTRLVRTMEDFEPVSERMRNDADGHFTRRPYVTRLLDRGPDRVSLYPDKLELTRNGTTTTTPADDATWPTLLADWFELD